MQANAAYDELLRRSREDSVLASCAELLGWDELTYMPRGGAANRGNQLALLAGMLHQRTTDPGLGDLLAVVEGSSLVCAPLTPAAVNVREWRRVFDRAARLPRSLVEEIARVTSLSQQGWLEAREHVDFARFRPWLEKVLDLKRREAECLATGNVLYDALLQEYEPGATSAEIGSLFDALRLDLVPLATELAATGPRANVSILCRAFPLDRQRVLGELAAATVGFDFHRGRLDTTPHPFFSDIGPGDYRITTRFALHNFSEAFFCVLHEVGHALYEHGLDSEHHGTPMGEAPSVSLHESQARLWENLVGRSRAFWEHFFPLTRRIFHAELADVTLPQFYFAINHVEPSLNRTRADEVTYNLHILVRFELERALLAGDLKAEDVPDAWNEAYLRNLGLTPANDLEGCLQDGHWGAGQIGYFPTYTLGNLIGAQLYARANADVPDLPEQFARGDFTGLLGWLGEKVYRQGQRYSAPRLVEHVTGEPLSHRPLVQMLRRKYEELA